VAARADVISERKRSLIEQKLKEESEAAVEAVSRHHEKIRVQDATRFSEKHARTLAEKDAEFAALDSKRKHQLESARIAHETEMRDHEEKLTTHFAMVLAKVNENTARKQVSSWRSVEHCTSPLTSSSSVI